MKKCCVCQELKPLDEFHREQSKKDGRQSMCKPCRCARNKVGRREWERRYIRKRLPDGTRLRVLRDQNMQKTEAGPT